MLLDLLVVGLMAFSNYYLESTTVLVVILVPNAMSGRGLLFNCELGLPAEPNLI